MSEQDESRELTDEEILAGITPQVMAVRARRVNRGNFPAVERLTVPATAEGLAKVDRWLPGAAIHGGPPSQREDRLATYRVAILALYDKGYRPAGRITARLVAQHVHRSSDSLLRKDVAHPDIGGWRAFRAEVLRAR